jgi:hypothetical protein
MEKSNPGEKPYGFLLDNRGDVVERGRLSLDQA